jgi:PAS domain S-box-containing protein
MGEPSQGRTPNAQGVAMTNRPRQSSAPPIYPNSLFHLVIVVSCVFILSYLAARLGGALVMRPEMIWPLWPGCAFLVAVLLLTPRRIWPAVLVAGLAAFALYDVQEALPIRTTGFLLGADSIEILVAALGVTYVFGGVPRLNSVKSLAKYSLFAVILSPVVVASAAANDLAGDVWWVGFFTEALALLTLTPAILSWVDIILTREKKPTAHSLEAALMFTGLATFAYFTFLGVGRESRPTLLYSLVPFLLWAALRFGITGTCNSIVLVAFMAIWGAIHGRGPFTGDTRVNSVLSLQLFLLVTAVSFMVLAAVVEEQKVSVHSLRKSAEAVRTSEERLRLAQQAASIGTFERNMRTGVVTWTTELEAMYGLPPGGFEGTTIAFFENLLHPDDRAKVMGAVEGTLKTGEPAKGEWRVLWPDGSTHWIAGRWKVFMDESGEPSRMIGVNIDVTERKRTEEALWEVNRNLEAQAALLQSREELLKIFVKSVPAGVAMLDRDMRYIQVSDRWCADYSVDSSQVLGRSHYELFPDIPQQWKEMHRRALEGETLRADEDSWNREGGITKWVRWEIHPWRTSGGIVGGILIFAEDITRRKQMEEALSGVSRRLIESQEQERVRIGRELHDDIVQRLALLAVQLEQIQQNSPDLHAEVRRRLGEIRKHSMEIATDIQSLSHELHSSKLEYLGLAVAMRSFCREFGELQKVEIDFQSHDLPSPVPPDVSLCLYRVLQEALHNSAKHSGVGHLEVRLWGTSDQIHLTVRDSGVGFDSEAAKKSRGLGLVSMQERMKLVNGTLSIESQPNRGTTISARVPFSAESDSMRAAG